ncbi:MAG: LacI family transcriptional regulator [Treponema sp.]|jgi:LacI family transcriptional regulator|nr:LacI family transcriptional regulator [Treponema sp.]
MVKLKDLAEHLNISISTVSRVLNNRDRVDDNTRKRVQRAIDEMGYISNEAARSLKRQYMKAIGVVVTDIENDYYSRLIRGIEEKAYEKEYHVFVCASSGNQKWELDNINMLLGMYMSGLVISTVFHRIPEKLQRRLNNIPVVFVDNQPDDCQQNELITVDNFELGKELTQKLIDNGHRHIGILMGMSNESSHRERVRGYNEALRLAGMKINDDLKWAGGFDAESGYETTKKMLCKNHFDALVAVNNFLAYGAIRAIREAKLRIPEDISVVCFDANDWNGLSQTKLTCFVQPTKKMGNLAAELIITAKDREPSSHKIHVMKAEFIEGNTVKRREGQ